MFNHLKKLEISDRTSWIEIPEVCPGAAVQVRPANDSNHPYQNAMLRRSGNRNRSLVRRGGSLTAQDVIDSRNEDRELYPIHIFVNWRGVLDDHNQPVDANRENFAVFCDQIPDWIFDRIRAHASTPERFLSGNEVTPSGQDIAGNSQSDSAQS